MKKLIALLITTILFISVGTTSFAYTYSDVPSSHWAYTAVNSVTNRNMFLPNGSGSYFYPNNTVSRGAFVQNLEKLMNDERKLNNYQMTGFSDVPFGSQYAGAVVWAVSHGITSGTSPTTFSPDAPITRQQACVMIVKCYTYYNFIYFPYIRTYQNFNDHSSISSWALDAVIAMYRAQLIDGGENNCFNPTSNIKRAEISQIFFKLYNELYFLNIYHIAQNTDDMCWAASAEMIAKYEYLPCTVDQDDIADHVNSPYHDQSVVAEAIDFAVNYTIQHYHYDNILSFYHLKSKILSFKPIYISCNNSMYILNNHAMVLFGYVKHQNKVYFIDPYTNQTVLLTHSTLTEGSGYNPNYGGSYTWCKSIYS